MNFSVALQPDCEEEEEWNGVTYFLGDVYLIRDGSIWDYPPDIFNIWASGIEIGDACSECSRGTFVSDWEDDLFCDECGTYEFELIPSQPGIVTRWRP